MRSCHSQNSTSNFSTLPASHTTSTALSKRHARRNHFSFPRKYPATLHPTCTAKRACLPRRAFALPLRVALTLASCELELDMGLGTNYLRRYSAWSTPVMHEKAEPSLLVMTASRSSFACPETVPSHHKVSETLKRQNFLPRLETRFDLLPAPNAGAENPPFNLNACARHVAWALLR